MKTDLENEIWKDVVGYEGLYQVSNLGRVYCMPKEWDITCGGKRKYVGNIASVKINNKSKYPVAMLSKNNKVKYVYVHRIAVEAFIGAIPKGLVVNHIDQIRTNNNINNLEVISQSENSLKSILSGKGYKLKLSKSEVEKIFMLREQGLSSRLIGKEIGVSNTFVLDILNGKLKSYLQYYGNK